VIRLRYSVCTQRQANCAEQGPFTVRANVRARMLVVIDLIDSNDDFPPTARSVNAVAVFKSDTRVSARVRA